MRNKVVDKFWHKTLNRPYLLFKRYDEGNGQVVILLHGVGRTGLVWQNLEDEFKNDPLRVISYDLLGFGESPKPTWLEYSVDDHVQAVVASIKALRTNESVIIIGHSMGCLIALRLARNYPELVKHLILYEMPLYKGLPNKRMYRIRLNFYQKLYKWALEYQPTFDGNTAAFKERLAKKYFGLEVDKDSWQPFIRSLEHTIFKQTAPEDLKEVVTPMDVVYGNYDMLILKGTVKHIIEPEAEHLKIHTVRAGHTVNKNASKLLRLRTLSTINIPDIIGS